MERRRVETKQTVLEPGPLQANVSRLANVMSRAEAEMEAAFERTGSVHKSTAARREAEVTELRRILAAKERAVDSVCIRTSFAPHNAAKKTARCDSVPVTLSPQLRETLSSTRRTLEARCAAAEGALRARDLEVQELREEATSLRTSKTAIQNRT